MPSCWNMQWGFSYPEGGWKGLEFIIVWGPCEAEKRPMHSVCRAGPSVRPAEEVASGIRLVRGDPFLSAYLPPPPPTPERKRNCGAWESAKALENRRSRCWGVMKSKGAQHWASPLGLRASGTCNKTLPCIPAPKNAHGQG